MNPISFISVGDNPWSRISLPPAGFSSGSLKSHWYYKILQKLGSDLDLYILNLWGGSFFGKYISKLFIFDRFAKVRDAAIAKL